MRGCYIENVLFQMGMFFTAPYVNMSPLTHEGLAAACIDSVGQVSAIRKARVFLFPHDSLAACSALVRSGCWIKGYIAHETGNNGKDPATVCWLLQKVRGSQAAASPTNEDHRSVLHLGDAEHPCMLFLLPAYSGSNDLQ